MSPLGVLFHLDRNCGCSDPGLHLQSLRISRRKKKWMTAYTPHGQSGCELNLAPLELFRDFILLKEASKFSELLLRVQTGVNFMKRPTEHKLEDR
jgi:hypothetical protein